MVADGLSALGLYITALQQGSATPREVLLPALLRFGLAEPDADRSRPTCAAPARSRRSTSTCRSRRSRRSTRTGRKRPHETSTREKLERAVGDLKRDAAVVVRCRRSRSRARPRSQAIKDARAPRPDRRLPRDPGPRARQAARDARRRRWCSWSTRPAREVDQELLEIFLEEASEVVATIGDEPRARAATSPHDREALTTIRRGFHTLKGSGRMVGLTTWARWRGSASR